MPTISMFYGILIMMYAKDNNQHHLPHVHVEYAEYSAVFSIQDGNLLSGKVPKKAEKLVQAWLEIHQEELMADWVLAMRGQELFKIDPLK